MAGVSGRSPSGATKSKLVRKVRRRGARAVRVLRESPLGQLHKSPASTDTDVNPLEAYFLANKGRLMHKWVHYFDIYHQHFARFRGKPVTILEFGVSHGGSLQMWKHYFGPKARIFGVDINPRCKEYEEPNIEIMIGDQGDRAFLQSVADRIGQIDVVIDDGGHRPEQMIATFEVLWPNVVNGGVLLIEDMHAAYYEELDGGYRREGTFVEYTKNLIDQMHAWYSRERDRFDVDEYTRTIRAIHVYDSIFVFDKARIPRPRTQRTGKPSF